MGFRRLCPAGRAACAAGGHFVACIPVLAGTIAGCCSAGLGVKLDRDRTRLLCEPEYAWM